MTRILLLVLIACLAAACTRPAPVEVAAQPVASAAPTTPAKPIIDYFDNSGRDDVLAGGEKMIEIDTPKGKFRVWTRRTGNNPTIKVLLLHGGPGGNHQAFAAFDSYFPDAGIEYYMYDQLGSTYSDQPHEDSLWETDRFVDELEQVRQALKLGPDNLYLVGHSWGGILAIEYALKYPDQLKGLVISNMMSSVPAYNTYAKTVLMPQMEPAVLAEVLAMEKRKDYANPRYEELLMTDFYTDHVLRMPLKQWPAAVLRSFADINKEIYVPMQGPSEMAASGKLEDWDRSADLKKITVPTLVIGAQHDTMDPKHMEWMAGQFPRGRYLHCANGSHLAFYDDQSTYMAGLIDFLKDVDGGNF